MLMLSNTRDLDGDDSDSQRVKDSYELEKAFKRLLAASSASTATPTAAASKADVTASGSKRKADDDGEDDGGAEADGDGGPADDKQGGDADDSIVAEDKGGVPKKAKREIEEEIRALHRTGGNATMLAERQDCTLHWLRKLMGYKDREFTELR